MSFLLVTILLVILFYILIGVGWLIPSQAFTSTYIEGCCLHHQDYIKIIHINAQGHSIGTVFVLPYPYLQSNSTARMNDNRMTSH